MLDKIFLKISQIFNRICTKLSIDMSIVFQKTLFPFNFTTVVSKDFIDIRSISCPVCGNITKIEPFDTNLRETGFCKCCGSWNRQRLMAVLLINLIERFTGVRVPHLSCEIPKTLKIYSAEWFGATHEALRRFPGYFWSRYSGGQYKSGDIVNGHPHQDLLATSFPENHFDIVLTSDVMEHIPEPYLAHREIYRILKPGGAHLFTVPCKMNTPLDEQWAALVGDKIVHLIPHPEWHGDEEDSNLVYTIFGMEMICHLWVLGFAVRLYEVFDTGKGIIDSNSVAFEAIKHHNPIPRPIPTGLRNCS